MKTLTLCAIAAILVAAPAYASTTATGTVFHDKNLNRVYDEGEPTVSEVLISNGIDVVKTDGSGAYELPVTNDSIIFVVQPKGWDVPVNEHNLPQFYYVHKPDGSPSDLKYAGVAPTGDLPDEINFPLYPSETDVEFSIFAFGDPQPYSLDDVFYYKRDIVEEAMHIEGPVAGVSLGDIVGDNLDFFAPMNEITAMMGRPWCHVYGNHDMNFDVEDGELADETWERVYGPASYAFEIGDVVFIAMDNVLYPNHFTDHTYTGGFTDKQLSFVENLLAHVPEDKLVVTLVHIPLYEESHGDTFVDEHRSDFFSLFKNHKNTFSLSAHTHTQNHVEFDAESHHHWPHIDVPHHHYNVGTTSGSWWAGEKDERGIPVTTMRDGVPNGYAILHFKGNQYSYDYYVANGPKDEVMSIYLPRAVQKGPGWTNQVIGINFYNGDDKTVVEYRVEGKDWWKAIKTLAPDPNYTYHRLARDKKAFPPSGTALPFPVNSTHQWFGRLPKNMDPGLYKVEVRVTDRFGRVFEDAGSYRIIGAE